MTDRPRKVELAPAQGGGTATLLSVKGLHKAYRRGKIVVPVLTGLDFDVAEGEFVSVVGASGSGKSTLLHVVGTLDHPDQGEILLEGRRIDNLPAAGRDRVRNQVFGFIFQFYHLLPELNVLENVLVPLMIRHSVFGWWWRKRAARAQAESLLERVGLGHRLKHRPRELSGGEMQRAAIARALISRPRILLADEPTGNLDASTGSEIVRLLRDLNRQEGLTIVMVTHNGEIAADADRVVRMAAGQLVTDTAARWPRPGGLPGTHHERQGLHQRQAV
jgi:lipoprotein-releasing system ATP-binding protein